MYLFFYHLIYLWLVFLSSYLFICVLIYICTIIMVYMYLADEPAGSKKWQRWQRKGVNLSLSSYLIYISISLYVYQSIYVINLLILLSVSLIYLSYVIFSFAHFISLYPLFLKWVTSTTDKRGFWGSSCSKPRLRDSWCRISFKGKD